MDELDTDVVEDVVEYVPLLSCDLEETDELVK